MLDSIHCLCGFASVDGRDALGINSIDVGFFNQRSNPTNAFQLVLVDRPDTGANNFDFEFNYDHIEWETGTARYASALKNASQLT